MRARMGVVAVVIGALAMAACGSSDSGGTASGGPKGDCPTAPLPVVVSVDQWGDIVDQLAGDCGDVTTIIKSSSADPHDYEPTPADTAAFTRREARRDERSRLRPVGRQGGRHARLEAGGRERRRGRRAAGRATTRTSGTDPTTCTRSRTRSPPSCRQLAPEGRRATSTRSHDAWRALDGARTTPRSRRSSQQPRAGRTPRPRALRLHGRSRWGSTTATPRGLPERRRQRVRSRARRHHRVRADPGRAERSTC